MEVLKKLSLSLSLRLYILQIIQKKLGLKTNKEKLYICLNIFFQFLIIEGNILK